MAEVNLNKELSGFDAGLDAVIIVNYIEGIPCGRALDVSGFPDAVISAGHVVIKETATNNYKPMPVRGGNSIATFGAITGGSSGATNGNYTGVALAGGSGSGAKAYVGVTGNAVTDIGVKAGGSGYKVGDMLAGVAGGVAFAVTVSAIVDKASYAALPSGHTIEGVTVSTVTTDEASVSIMVRGSVNKVASRYPVTPEIEAALPLIRFTQD